MTLLKHLQAIILLPGVATLVIPILILSTYPTNIGWNLSPSFNLLPPIAGILLIGLGLTLMVKTISLFATLGQGTLAPWTPTRRLVVRGIYRYVRNPMISGVFSILLGEAVLFGSRPLFYWFAAFVVVNLVYMILVEEPGLERRFGADYEVYKQNVPRWLPRWRPWHAPWEEKR
jgi:protein-S-isoprenylcysteine O-methyltransferase Ste14